MLKSNERMLDHNYGGRRNCTIESPLLEKRCNIDHATMNGKKNVWLIADWKACFDRQLPEIGALTCRSLGLEEDISKRMNTIGEVKNIHMIKNSIGEFIGKAYITFNEIKSVERSCISPLMKHLIKPPTKPLHC